eukprot:Lithocolla_globosa_v1_NODE_2080_length_2177_cov_4.804901.p1 type:complete len:450 gc:universal NODE_2080_length_2177_cov_4.804901:1502-153(-)
MELTKHLTEQGQLALSPSFCQELLQNFGEEKTVEAISSLIISKKLTFPYKRYFIGHPLIKFRSLKTYKQPVSTQPFRVPTLELRSNPSYGLINFTFNGEPLVLESNKTDYENINCLSDIFQEEARVSSSVDGRPRPLSQWHNVSFHPRFLRPLVKRSPKNGINSFELRESLFEVTKLDETSTFKSTVAREIILRLNGTRVLDFCSGWGDRLIGALSLQEKIDYYVGVDPNPQLHPNYQSMIQTLVHPRYVQKFQMIQSPFERCDLEKIFLQDLREEDRDRSSNDMFDLVFTSPPYFDHEVYGDGLDSSSSNFPNFSQWLENFLFFSICKAWYYLKEGGHLALSMGDTSNLLRQGKPYVEGTILFISHHLAGVVSLGIIAFAGAQATNKARPVWIFQKDNSKAQTTASRQKRKQAGEELKRWYPVIWQAYQKHNNDQTSAHFHCSNNMEF